MPTTVRSPTRTRVVSIPVLLLTLSLTPVAANAAPVLVQDFANVASLAGAGWSLINNSAPAGATGWFQGNTGVFPAQDGTDDYIAANFLNAAVGGDISNWLLLPALTLNDGDNVTFLTRADGGIPDRLEVRFSASGASANVGTTAASVGDFSRLLLTINPALGSAYPTVWTSFTATLSGLGGATNGRLAFRYAVPNTLVNGNYIGIDSVVVNATVVPEPALLSLLGVGLIALHRRGRIKSLIKR